MRSPPALPTIYGETLESLTALLKEHGHPAFRGRQIMTWLYKKRARTWAEMTDLSQPLRAWLAATFELEPTKFVLTRQSEDVTDKLLLELADRSLIETVIIRALTILNAGWGLGFGARRITLSTSGLVPRIRQLADEPLGLRLAISLHGATDEVREQIMPINKKWPLKELLPAVREFSEKHGRMVTLEFILIEAVNDSLDQARKLRDIALDLHAHVNLIPYNTVAVLPWKRPSLTRQEKFAQVLDRGGVSVTLRREKGHAIDAACGQLRLQTEKAREAAAS